MFLKCFTNIPRSALDLVLAPLKNNFRFRFQIFRYRFEMKKEDLPVDNNYPIKCWFLDQGLAK